MDDISQADSAATLAGCQAPATEVSILSLTPITATQFHDAWGTGDWRIVGDGAVTTFRTGTFLAGARLVAAIAELPGIDAAEPDIDVRRDAVTIRLITITDDYYGMTERDIETARAISGAAQRLGFQGSWDDVQSFMVIPGAPDTATVMPFWRALLGYQPRADSPEEDLVDPRRRGPAFWFEQMREPRGEGGGGAIHVAVWVPYEQAEARVAAALAAGGRVVRERAPMWWTLADAAGNEADISTVKGRD
jgi:4a-hydroxytetrahydrobiopterin dehydratase